MNKTTVHDSQPIRCAIYTRKSTEEGLEQAFNSLDAQRESAEAYIASQKNEGWVCLPDRYDDGGFTGGNLDRPAVRRLLKDMEAGKIDCVVVYKVDRLSRSLMDFSRIMQIFEKQKVSFVSVTQQFNTTHSMGRLTLNILLSFAQFEREIISERTRDKIAASRRKGKYAGGRPVLGYDVLKQPSGSKLVINADEAQQVRSIFELYLHHQALIPTVIELNRRGWRTKTWQPASGNTVGGREWGKTELFHLLTNVIYLGKVRYHQEIHPGEHAAIIDESLWQKVQAVLQRNGRSGGALVRNKHGALLKGLLRCAACDCAMGHTYTSKGSRRYRYYVCLNGHRKGRQVCPSKSLPAGEIEQFVVQQIQCIGKDPGILAATIRQTSQKVQQQLAELKAEENLLKRDLNRCGAELQKLAKENADPSRLAELQDRIRIDQHQISAAQQQILHLGNESIDEHQVKQVLGRFAPIWETLSPKEQARIIQLLIERVDYDGKQGTVSLTFRPSGIKSLGQTIEEIAA